jgi:hypothetical protein
MLFFDAGLSERSEDLSAWRIPPFGAAGFFKTYNHLHVDFRKLLGSIVA